MTFENNPDLSMDILKKIGTEFKELCDSKGKVSEADTRIKIVDRVLKEVLFWPEKLISREDHVTGDKNGFTDYQLLIHNRPYVTIEAKREGISFELPHVSGRKHLKLSTIIEGNNDVSKAVKQVRDYCDDLGIRYAITTNGYSWILFRALRDDMPWREGYARIFYSFTDIINNFGDFFNLLNFNSITEGSFEKEFSSVPVVSRGQARVLDKLYNSDLPLERNRLHAQLDKFINAFFKDIADQDYIKILESCYVYSKSLNITIKSLDIMINDAIPRFLKNEGTIEAKPGPKDSGNFQEKMQKSIENNTGELYLILGGIGSGKTTFIKRYFRIGEQEFLKNRAVWFYVSLLGPPTDAKEIEQFIWNQILSQLREKYNDIIIENRKTIKKAFEKEIQILNETTFKIEKLKSDEYERRLSPYLERWQNDINEYVPRLLQLCQIRNRTVIVCVDNVDQLSPESQAEVFLLAQSITRKVNSITVLTLREETYYNARIQKVFTAYSNQKFHIASPNFLQLIAKRLAYAKQVLDLPEEELRLVLKSGIQLDKKSIIDFLSIIEYSVFKYNKNITRFIEAVCFGNMRLALEMFSIFLISGATDVDKMLNIYNRDGIYYVPFHEFIKSVILEDRRYYKEAASKVMNLYNCGAERNSSHFTALRLLQFLLKRRSNYTYEGQGYVDIANIVTIFDDIFDNREDLLNTSNRLLKWNLIEVNTRSTETIIGASHMRLTSAGWYYLKYLVRSFVYIDLVLQDTPIDDRNTYDELLRFTKEIDNLTGRDEDKIIKTDTRFTRTDKFIEYLIEQENFEIKNNPRILTFEDFKEKQMDGIFSKYKNEKEWIRKRLKENALKYMNDLMTYEAENAQEDEDEQVFLSNTEESDT